MARFQNMCYLLFLLWTIISSSVCVLADDLDNFSFNNGRLINDFFYENQDLSALQVDDWEDEESTVEDKQAHVRTALLNALKDGKQLRRFAEVLPIIRVMSSPQRIALAALVSAQIAHEKEGTEGNGLSLPQVRRMFGDDPELILPVTLDIANLIRDTTRARGRSIASEHEFVPNAQALRRMLELPHKDNDEDDDEDEDEHIGEVLVTSGDDRDLSNEVILGNSTNIRDNFRDFKPQFDDSLTMRKNATERPKPIKLAKDQLAMPSDDIHMVVALPPSNETLTSFNGTNEDLPQAEQLRWHKRPIPFKPNHFRRPGLSHIANDLLNSDQKALNCFSRSLCLSTDDYPMDSIKASIRRNKNAMAALIVEYRDKDDEIQNIDLSDKPDLDRLGEEGTNSVPGTMCPSIVRYARPQKARSATGHWKYVVNTGEHTQTLRLEKCSRPNEPCTYLTDNFKSRCVQVYNYHRLLSWDANRGLHVDIFKIPTCCSCHIDDYKIAYPPVSPQKETTREVFPGKDYSNEADEYQDDHLGEDTQLYERDVNQFHFSPTNTNKKYNKNNLGTRGLDTKHRPTLIRDSEFESMMEDPETTTQTYNMISMYPVSTGRRKPTKNQGLPSFLEAPKPPRTRFPSSHKIIPLTTNNYKRGVGSFNTFDFSKRNVRRPSRYNEQFPADSMYDSSEDKLNHFTMQGYDITTDMYDSMQKSPPWQRMVHTIPRTTLLQTNPTNKRILYGRTPNIKATTTTRPVMKHNLDHLTTKVRIPTRSTTELPFEYDNDYSEEKDNKRNEDDKKRINYNYHPIIEFFDGVSKKRGAESRSGDSDILSSGETDWRPMTAP